MPVKIRLQRHGAKKKPIYFIVVANSRSPRDGKFIEKLGTYNPLTVPATIQVNRERALHWLNKGAETTHTTRRILSFKGVLYLKHLMRGVKLGLFNEVEAIQKFKSWNEEHEKLVEERQKQHKKEKLAKRNAPVVKKVEDVSEEPQAETPIEEAATEEMAPADDTPAEEGGEETPETEG